MAGDGDPRVERTRATVVGVVHRLLRDEGPAAVTFGRVSREAGVSRTTLYRHWDSPSDLVSEAWARLPRPDPPVASADLRSDLVALARRTRDAVESRTMRRSLPTFLAQAADDPVAARLHGAFIEERRRPAVERLALAREDGEVDDDVDVDLIVDLLSGPLFYRQLLRHQRTTDARVEAIVDAALRAAGFSRSA